MDIEKKVILHQTLIGFQLFTLLKNVVPILLLNSFKYSILFKLIFCIILICRKQEGSRGHTTGIPQSSKGSGPLTSAVGGLVIFPSKLKLCLVFYMYLFILKVKLFSMLIPTVAPFLPLFTVSIKHH